jgi:hypothetical protein
VAAAEPLKAVEEQKQVVPVAQVEAVADKAQALREPVVQVV